jgi:hypothetical protein
MREEDDNDEIVVIGKQLEMFNLSIASIMSKNDKSKEVEKFEECYLAAKKQL